MQTTFEFECPDCYANLTKPHYLIGTKTVCVECGHRVRIPDPNTTSLTAAGDIAWPTPHATAICRKPLLGASFLQDALRRRIDDEEEERLSVYERNLAKWAMFLHLAHLFNFIIPCSGLALQFVVWQWKQLEFSELDLHGKNAINWCLTSMLYCLPMVGTPVSVGLFALSMVFPIIAALYADEGVEWPYPFAIRFIS